MTHVDNAAWWFDKKTVSVAGRKMRTEREEKRLCRRSLKAYAALSLRQSHAVLSICGALDPERSYYKRIHSTRDVHARGYTATKKNTYVITLVDANCPPFCQTWIRYVANCVVNWIKPTRNRVCHSSVQPLRYMQNIWGMLTVFHFFLLWILYSMCIKEQRHICERHENPKAPNVWQIVCVCVAPTQSGFN